MNIFNTIAEYVILPVSDLVTGNSVSSKLRFLQKSQWWSEEQLIDYQNKRLNSIIKYAYSSVPYYTDLFDSLKIKPKDILNINDLEKLPLLNKEIIRKEGIERFASKTFSHRNRLQKSSSGSTGEPLFYYTTKDAYSMSLAASLRGWYWMGFRLGDKYIKLSQNPRKSKIKRIQDYFSNKIDSG
jgi:phenylacetate-CoA ligase